MSIFSFFRRKNNLLSTTKNMISELSKLREVLSTEERLTDAEFGKMQKMIEHIGAVEKKIMEHSEILNSMNPKDKHRLAVLQAEFGDIEELRRANDLFYEELNRLTELQEAITKQIRGVQQEERDQMRAIEEGYSSALRGDIDPKVQKYLDFFNSKKR